MTHAHPIAAPWSRALTGGIGVGGARELWGRFAADLAWRDVFLERDVERNTHDLSHWTTGHYWPRDVDVRAGSADWPPEFQHHHSFPEHMDSGDDNINHCLDADGRSPRANRWHRTLHLAAWVHE